MKNFTHRWPQLGQYFFLQIRALFSNFCRRAEETAPRPSSYAPVLIYLKYWYYNSPYLEIPCLPDHLCQIFPCQLKPSSTQSSSYSSSVSLFCLSYSTTGHQKYWIYQTIGKIKPIKFITNLCANHNTLWVKHVTHQKAESLRVASLSKLDNMVNSNSIINKKYVEWSTKW